MQMTHTTYDILPKAFKSYESDMMSQEYTISPSLIHFDQNKSMIGSIPFKSILSAYISLLCRIESAIQPFHDCTCTINQHQKLSFP